MQADTPGWPELAARTRAVCDVDGLDLVHAFPLGACRALLTEPELGVLGLSGDDRLALLVGNTLALWPRFRAALAADPELAGSSDPLDRYVERSVERARLALGASAAVHFAHVREPAPLPIQRIAQASGLAWLSPSHLSIHPLHGPWIALRALVVVDVPGPSQISPTPDPCTACDKPCLPALNAALDGELVASPGAEPPRWRAWLRIRDACPIGRGSRYAEDQIEYHYGQLTTLCRR